MATSTATLSAILTLDDRASPGLVKTTQNSAALRASFISTAQSLATFTSSMASLLVTTGALDSKTGRYVTSALAMSGALLSIIGPLTKLNTLLRQTAVIQAFLATLRNPLLGIGLVAAAGAAAVGAGVLIGRASAAGNNSAGLPLSNRGAASGSGWPMVINNDLRGATIRGENDLNEISRRVSRSVIPRP